MSELKPCPRCGSTVSMYVSCIEPGWWIGSIFCDGIEDGTCSIQFTGGADTREELVEGIASDWNERFEATCQNISDDKEENFFECSVCGNHITDCEGYYVSGTWNYCSKCGRKVVD